MLPLTLHHGEIWHQHMDAQPSLQLRVDEVQEPSQLVHDFLAQLGLVASVVHSTSWRYELDHLVLTYAAITPHTHDLGQLWRRERIGHHELARGSATGPPAKIGLAAVVEHALRHLSWLSRDDEVIRSALSPEWIEVLMSYEPEPFRAL